MIFNKLNDSQDLGYEHLSYVWLLTFLIHGYQARPLTRSKGRSLKQEEVDQLKGAYEFEIHRF